MLYDQSSDQQGTEDAQKDCGRISFFLLRDFLGQLWQGYVHGQGYFRDRLEGIAVGYRVRTESHNKSSSPVGEPLS